MAYIGTQPTVGNFVKLDAITTSATATYNLTNGGVAYSPQSANHCLVSLNGVIQEPTSASNVGGFTISGSTIVFTSALTSSDVIDFILVLGDVLNIGTPSDATVTFPKVTSNLITGATAETSIAGGDQILIYDDSATALRKMTRTNFVAGIGGVNTPAFQARNGSNQDIGYTGVYTKITANTEVFDTNSKYDNSTNYRFTPTVAGKYYCYANIQFESTSASNNGDNLITTTAAIYKNGTAAAYSQLNKGTQAAGYKKRSEQVISILDLDADDYIELYAMADNGIAGSTTVVADATATYFGAFKIIE